MGRNREHWGSRLGIILAVAGSAVGLGNFLRFPAKATLNGGGAFMIPYFIAFILLGIPLMWIEWSLGRLGGARGHGTAPGMFDAISKNSFTKYLGTIGILGPFIILIYYVFIESWTLGYAYYSLSGHLFRATDQESMKAFLQGYQGLVSNEFFQSIGPAYLFFVITFLTNFYFIYRGIQGGIEKLSRYGMPILVIIGVFLTIRVFTLGAPDPARPELSVLNGLGFVWNPDFTKLLDSKVWLEAAGQIFFTLSVGIGVILTYASYLKRNDDVVLSGLTAASTNEFCEVILGGSIVIPAAFIFFGGAGALEIAQSGTFNIGFVTMPLIFMKLPLGALFSGLWFLLLFIAGITSSVSLIQPFMAFFEDEFGISRQKAVVILGILAFIFSHAAIFGLSKGILDELDFWGGTFFLVLFGTIEIILFIWVYGIDNAWKEMHHGARIRIPRIYRFIMKYVSPLFLLVLLGTFLYQNFDTMFLMKNALPENIPYIWGTRLMILVLWTGMMMLTAYAWKKTGKERV